MFEGAGLRETGGCVADFKGIRSDRAHRPESTCSTRLDDILGCQCSGVRVASARAGPPGRCTPRPGALRAEHAQEAARSAGGWPRPGGGGRHAAESGEQRRRAFAAHCGACRRRGRCVGRPPRGSGLSVGADIAGSAADGRRSRRTGRGGRRWNDAPFVPAPRRRTRGGGGLCPRERRRSRGCAGGGGRGALGGGRAAAALAADARRPPRLLVRRAKRRALAVRGGRRRSRSSRRWCSSTSPP